MPATTPAYEPEEFTAGETLKWTKRLADYPASEGWTLTYYFRGVGCQFDATASASGDDYAVTVTAETTVGLQPGAYFWQAWVSLGDEKYMADSGRAAVKQALAGDVGAFDGRSQVKRILDAVDAMLEGKATLDQQEYQIGSRSLRRIPVPDLIQLRDKYARLYASELRAERLRAGAPFFRTVLVRFD